MKMKRIPQVIVILLMSLLVFAACGKKTNDNTQNNTTPETPLNNAEPGVAVVGGDSENNDEEAVLLNAEGKIRVFQNGDANIRLYPLDVKEQRGHFIANLFDFMKITGTYTELTDDESGDSAIMFSYNGRTIRTARQNQSFEVTGIKSDEGVIRDNVLTVPEEWAGGEVDSNGLPRVNFTYRAYPIVFSNDIGQTITLNADDSFVADFSDDILILGFYTLRSDWIVFVPGNPSTNSSGEVARYTLISPLSISGVQAENPEGENEGPQIISTHSFVIHEMWHDIIEDEELRTFTSQ